MLVSLSLFHSNLNVHTKPESLGHHDIELALKSVAWVSDREFVCVCYH
jgi:hypothetical protein